MIPRAAYIHVPFCRHRCGYCNFTLIAGRDDLIDAYLQALEQELRGGGGPHIVDTLFFGGGTPTHLHTRQLERLFEIVQQSFVLAEGGELSVEANPRDLSSRADSPIGVLAAAGVTRVSLGAQSFDPRKLQLLERDHAAVDIERAFATCRTFAKSLSLDLIFGAPGETLADWRRDLDLALALAPDHVSTYGLTFEKGTAFWSRRSHGELASIPEETERQMYELAIDTLTAAGFEHYEVSNFARSRPPTPSGPGLPVDVAAAPVPSRSEGTTFRCRHNENYWLGGQYFAAGPGAARFIGGRRETNHRSTSTYISRVLAGQSPVAESEQLGPEDAARERLVFALRRLEGIDEAAFAAAAGYSPEQLGGQALSRLIDHGLLERAGGRLRLTRAGLMVSDAIWPELL